MNRAQNVDVERRHPILVGRIGDATEERVEGRDLHEAVDRTEAIDGATHQRRALVGIGDVGGDGRRALARWVELTRQRREPIGAARRHHHVGAVAQRDRHHLSAEAGADSGYNDGLSLENHGAGL